MRKRRSHGLLIFTLVCVILLVGGIFLATRTRTERGYPVQGDTWKLVVGTMLASFGGFGFIGGMIIVLKHRQRYGAAIPGLTDPHEALMKGQISQARYDAIRKKGIVALVIVTALSACMLALWLNTFSIVLAILMILGGIGALVLIGSGKGGLFALAGIAGIVAGVLVIASSNVDTSKRYAYFINGIKIGEGNGATSNTLGGLLGSVFLVGGLIVGVAYAITAICSLATRTV